MRRRLHVSDASPWAVRDFRISAPCRALVSAANASTLTVLTLQIYGAGYGSRLVAILLIVVALPTVALAPIAGRIADESESTRTLLITAAGGVAALVGMSLISDLAWLLILVLLYQGMQAVSDPTWVALTPMLVGEARTGQAVAITQGLATTAMVIGPALGGIAVAGFGTGPALRINACALVIQALAAPLIRARRNARSSDAKSDDTPRDAWAGMRIVAADVLLRSVVMMLLAFVVGAEAINVIEVFLIRDSFNAGPGVYGVANAVTAGGLVVGALLAGRWRTERTRLRAVAASAISMALLIVITGLAPILAIALGAFLLIGIANGTLTASFGAVLILRTPERLRGRVAAMVNALFRACALIGPAVGGLVGSLASPRQSFVLVGATMFVVTSLLALPLLRQTSKPASASTD